MPQRKVFWSIFQNCNYLHIHFTDISLWWSCVLLCVWPHPVCPSHTEFRFIPNLSAQFCQIVHVPRQRFYSFHKAQLLCDTFTETCRHNKAVRHSFQRGFWGDGTQRPSIPTFILLLLKIGDLLQSGSKDRRVKPVLVSILLTLCWGAT